MARPVVSAIADSMYDEGLLPLAYADELNLWALLHFCEAYIGSLQLVETLVRDTDDGPGWSMVLDVDRAPYFGLPWLGQFVGVTTPEQMTGETEAAHDARVRAYIASTGGFNRGTLAAVIGAVQQYLTGSKEVIITERDTSPYHFDVRSREGETLIGNVPLIIQAIENIKPAGVQFLYTRVPDWTYDDLNATAATYDALEALHTDYDDMEAP